MDGIIHLHFQCSNFSKSFIIIRQRSLYAQTVQTVIKFLICNPPRTSYPLKNQDGLIFLFPKAKTFS